MVPRLTASMGCHLSYGVTQCYLPPALTPARGRYLIYLPRRDGRLSWTWVTGYILRWFTRPQTVTHPST